MQARASPAGRRSTAAPRCPGPSASSSTSGTSSTARCAWTCAILVRTVRMVVTGHGLYKGETGGWVDPPKPDASPSAATAARPGGSRRIDDKAVLLTGVGQALRHRQRVRAAHDRRRRRPQPARARAVRGDGPHLRPADRRPRLRPGAAARCASEHDVGAIVPLTDLDIEVLAHARADGRLPQALVPAAARPPRRPTTSTRRTCCSSASASRRRRRSCPATRRRSPTR